MKEGPFTRWLIARFASGQGSEVARKARLGLLEGYISILVNTVLFAVKLVLGLMIGSIALVADAIHTAGDSVTSVVIIASAYVARKPPDRQHPFGHERAEAIAALVVAVLLGVAAVELGKSAVVKVLHPEAMSVPVWVMVVVAVTLGIKQWLSQFALVLSRRADSKALKADAWHHLTDVFATGLVLVGIIGSRFGVHWLDGVMGLLVCAIIMLAAYLIAKEALSPLLGEAPSAEEIGLIAERARKVEGVMGVHDIVVHRYGSTRIITLHVETSHRLSARELHAIAESVERSVDGEEHGKVVVHVDPTDRDHPDYEGIQKLVGQLLDTDRRLLSFHDLRMVDEGDKLVMEVDLSTSESLGEADRAVFLERFQQLAKGHHKPVVARLHFDPAFAYSLEEPEPGEKEAK